MKGRLLVAEFASESALSAGVREVASQGVEIHDVYAPYPIPELQEQIVSRPSRLPWICLALAVAGAGFKLWFEFWTSAADWPLNVGGKPWNSLFAFIPVTFEVMVLFAVVSTVIAFLVRRRLYPWCQPGRLGQIGVNGSFGLALEINEESTDIVRLVAMLNEAGAVNVDEEVRR